jgi:hypothetical protein
MMHTFQLLFNLEAVFTYATKNKTQIFPEFCLNFRGRVLSWEMTLISFSSSISSDY